MDSRFVAAGGLMSYGTNLAARQMEQGMSLDDIELITAADRLIELT
jgi:hypothetical protein